MPGKEDLVEVEDRFCPICGARVKAGSRLHSCSKRSIRKIEAEEREDIIINDDERTFGERMMEFDEFFNNSTYYDDDIEEE